MGIKKLSKEKIWIGDDETHTVCTKFLRIQGKEVPVLDIPLWFTSKFEDEYGSKDNEVTGFVYVSIRVTIIPVRHVLPYLSPFILFNSEITLGR